MHTESIGEALAARIRETLAREGRSRRSLADAARIPAQTVSSLLKEGPYRRDIDTMHALAHAAGVDFADLFASH